MAKQSETILDSIIIIVVSMIVFILFITKDIIQNIQKEKLLEKILEEINKIFLQFNVNNVWKDLLMQATVIIFLSIGIIIIGYFLMKTSVRS